MLLNSLHDLIRFINNRETIMLAQLQQLSEINSGSRHLAGLKMMQQALHTAFIPLADEIQILPPPAISNYDMQGNTVLQTFGESLFIRKRPELSPRILLCGHMDTVFDEHHPFQKLTRLDDNRLQGPGVADMKGGLVVLLQALVAFERTPFAHQLGWDVFINAEEEIGSPASQLFLHQIAANYQAGLVYEPTMEDGLMARNRKGSGHFTVIVEGKSAHSGRDFHLGKNAIAHLSRVLVAIDGLNGQREGVTINIGKILGGEALNIVAERAVAKFEVRISKESDAAFMEEALQTTLKNASKPGFKVELEGSFHRPVKQVNQSTIQLFERLQQVAKELHLQLHWKDSGGCCDGNNLMAYGLPTLDTMGVRGGGIHSSEEYIFIDSLVERAALSALLLVDLAQGVHALAG